MKIVKALKALCLILAIPLLMVTCTSAPEEFEEEFIPSYERLQAQTLDHRNGSIYGGGLGLTLFEDAKARRVGDILTVLLIEETSGQNSMDNSLSSSTELNLDTPIFGGSSEPDFNYEIGGDNAFQGASGSSQSNQLSGSIAVTVHQVLPNGNLVVEGEKWIRINQANEYVKLQGVVRPIDIGTTNTLYSTQVADARITYAGRGTNSQSNTPGWAAKIIFSPFWPF